MDSSEAAKIVHERIRQLEPNVANKILGYLYLQEVPPQEMIRLALGPDTLILNLIRNAKSSLLILPSPHFNPFPPRYFPNGTDAFNSVKTCHYFNRGFCKHGANCRYSHAEPFPDTPNYPVMFYEDKHLLHPFSLEKLEMEIVELLKSRKCHPISIASLPMMYFERYGRTLQAEGYLTESQRHGKAGYNLTRLLAQLKSIRLVDRPHGQHAVMLAEHAPKYLEVRADRCYSNIQAAVNGSRQLYLTFPAESVFNEEDVSAYFSTFGPVQDVRIPFQQKRMFGFVTFVSAYTVKCILSQGNPHYICGARVLVKPYREKSKLAERKYLKKLEPHVNYQPHAMDIESELESRFLYNLSRRRFMVEQNKALELETRHLSQLQISPNPLISHQPNPSLDSSADEQKYSVDNFSDRESSQGLNLPDSPFTSSISAM